MTVSADSQTDRLLRTEIVGSRRLGSYAIATIVTIGSVGFLLAGLSSYLGVNLLLFSDPTKLVFVPQGLVMGLYGTAGSLLATYLWLTIQWNVGGGYNEFDHTSGKATIFRWGYPGKNREVKLVCNLSAIQAVRVDLKEGINPKRALYLRAKNMRDIPLTRVGQPLSLSQLETEGAALAKFLGVPLEGL
ncbi:MAG: photosystem I assembly protein Ycf4 [Oscillatoriales cyanobacterium]|nr:MAG: photosystem I assembly protein Ycf4 [Oscillatoriales cyanobacterium]